jgi:hypothetical protein
LRKLSPRIRVEGQRIYHQGIDAYVAGDPQKAIQLWQEALQIDPSNSAEIQRDILKAQKLMDLNSVTK